ncbi:MAG: hypothetical protein JO353_10080 [Phycisphaerae bacterium]|nr:hypothetical protein [Phycisphaerae bacterium]
MTARKSLRFFDKRFANVKVGKTGLNFVLDWTQPIPWYVPKGQQKYTQ